MKSVYIFLIGIIVFCSCGNKLNGRIETRDGGDYYLVNHSKNKIYKFTVRKTVVKNDSTTNYYSEFYTLNPGEEKYLGVKYYDSEIMYEQKEIKEKNLIHATKEGRDPLLLGYGKEKSSPDTVINGEAYYLILTSRFENDLSKPSHQDHFTHKYEVTGEVLLK